MADQSDTPERAPAPTPLPAGSLQPTRRHRALVWSLIVLASVLLIVSITANWVQREALDTNQVRNTTDQILADEDVQQELSIYLVDQLYANVDVQAQLEQQLPSSAKALSVPLAAATRQLALNVSEKALASPRVQALVSNAVRAAHQQFVKLIRDKGEYVSTTGGDVTIEYGAVVADLAARLGVDPATISEIQGIVQELLEGPQGGPDRGSGPDQGSARRTRSGAGRLAEPAAGTRSDDAPGEARLSSRRRSPASRRRSRARRRRSPPRSRAAWPSLIFSCPTSIVRLTARQNQIAAVLKDPSQANVQQLDATLATVETRVTALLGRPIVQTPGKLVVMKSSQLDGVQTAVRVLRSLGLVLPLWCCCCTWAPSSWRGGGVGKP